MSNKVVELVKAHRAEILDKLNQEWEDIIRCDGRIQYKLYIWEDGELEGLEDAQGSNTWLQPRSAETRELYYIGRLESPFFDWRDLVIDSLPDEDEEPEAYAAVKEDAYQCAIDDFDADEWLDGQIKARSVHDWN